MTTSYDEIATIKNSIDVIVNSIQAANLPTHHFELVIHKSSNDRVSGFCTIDPSASAHQRMAMEQCMRDINETIKSLQAPLCLFSDRIRLKKGAPVDASALRMTFNGSDLSNIYYKQQHKSRCFSFDTQHAGLPHTLALARNLDCFIRHSDFSITSSELSKKRNVELLNGDNPAALAMIIAGHEDTVSSRFEGKAFEESQEANLKSAKSILKECADLYEDA